MDFQITDTKPMNKNTLRGIFSLVVGPMKIEGWTFHVKDDRSWVNPPSKEYIDKESGEKKYWPIVRIEDDERYRSFQKWCKEQVGDIFMQAEQTTQNESDSEDTPF